MNKEELKDKLKKYRGILNDSMIDYLNSVIELEFSIIREYISNEEKEKLSELDIYKEIANYNINNRALNLIKTKENIIDTIIKNDDEELRIYADIGGSSIILFNFNSISQENFGIGNISLYRTINSIEQTEKEIYRIISMLDFLYNEKNPYPHVNNVYGGPSANWALNHNNKIQQYEDKLRKIQEKIELTDKDKKEIEITNMIHELLLEDYGLTSDSFVENRLPKRAIHEQSELYKRYIKKTPKINIKDNIKYI